MPDTPAPNDNSAFVAAFMDASPDPYFFKDAACIYRYVNKAFCDLFGIARETIIGRSDFDIFPRVNARRHRRADLSVLSSGRFASFDYEVIHMGRAVWLQVVKTPVRDASGRIAGLLCAARNITTGKQLEAGAGILRNDRSQDLAEATDDLRRINQELRRQVIQRHQAEKALEESLRTVNLIFENSPIGISLVSERIVRRANPRFHELFASSPGGIVGRSTAAFYPDQAAFEAFGEEFYPALGRGERVDTVRLMRRFDGTDFWCRIIGQVLFPERPQAGSIWIMEDVTERRLAEEAALAADRLKREFTDNMSHEVRTPLNGIMGMIQMLEATELSAEQQEWLGTLRQCAGNLVDLLEGMLDFSRLDSGGGEPPRREPFSIRDIVQGTCNSFLSAARRKGLALVSRISLDIPEVVLGDGGGLRRVLAALVGNAVKFTPAGTVELDVARGWGCRSVPDASRDGGTVYLAFSVRDTGIGLAPETLPGIFEPFRQVDGSMTRRFGGAGLGLAIARKVAEAMGGYLDVQSKPGKGSTFCFCVPFALPDTADAPDTPGA
ncbi:PAS domain-containing sensor histidine kinase [Solidesulfovibrio alcoholivorans]|uniref:PAS domain-containing sensor histidine kinase n=1 Tax=Solidesulfovibrio alcoholivorans TaxID=81406 RepID=UPI000494E3DF|nr:PAS domain-containing protein [Solidesulfovibrio alcoholivorans]